jgi:hypothetical protein
LQRVQVALLAIVLFGGITLQLANLQLLCIFMDMAWTDGALTALFATDAPFIDPDMPPENSQVL